VNLHLKTDEEKRENAVNALSLPYISRFRDSNGRDQITVRSPVMQALKTHLEKSESVGTMCFSFNMP
jgi:hypothetical protein